ncbi:MAG: 30S ribosomal protein S20 [Planctomycetes bacterium]|nr:30S ribosomal protein S20 [Planctomycetota bacterium]
MPHTKSAKKSLRKNEKRRLSNKAAKKAIKLQIRKVTDPAAGAPLDQVRADLLVAIKKLDKAAAKRVLHPNTAARRKSRLARLLNARAAAK